jgi:hypothetical protein
MSAKQKCRFIGGIADGVFHEMPVNELTPGKVVQIDCMAGWLVKSTVFAEPHEFFGIDEYEMKVWGIFEFVGHDSGA